MMHNYYTYSENKSMYFVYMVNSTQILEKLRSARKRRCGEKFDGEYKKKFWNDESRGVLCKLVAISIIP